jgi:hypothetical protein
MNEGPREFGEIPGYEFDAPRVPGHARQGSGLGQRRHQAWPQAGQPTWPPTWPQEQPQQWRPREQWPQAPADAAPPGRLGRDILAAMRARNWVISLALPLLAAIAVGIAVVVIVGANGSIGTTPTAIDAGFPPARLATADFGGGRAGSPVQLSAIAVAGATQVATGSAGGGLALWVSDDGGSTWKRGVVTSAGDVRPGSGQLAWVAHGAAGWLAVGDATAGQGAATPVVLGSQDGRRWTAAGGTGTFAVAGAARDRTVTAAVAAGGAGYVIVGHASVGPRTVAAAWYAPGRTGWRRGTGAQPGALDGPGNRVMSAVTATSRGFTAVGAVGARPAAWLSRTGRTWTLVTLPPPAGAASAALDYVAANGATVAAIGTEVTATGQRRPFDAMSGDAGATWTVALLPLPAGSTAATAASAASAAAATALTAAGGGFTATGTYGVPGETDVVVWTLPAGAAAGTAWTAVAPQGTGLSSPGMQAISALTATGDTLIGVGYTTRTATATATEPTIWQSPVRS